MKIKHRDIAIFFVITGILILIPILFYWKYFNGPISRDSSEWANFGGFLSGTIGTILSVLTLLITVFIAKRVSEIEDERLEDTNEKLAKPYCRYHVFTYMDYVGIEVMNVGLGPMIINRMDITDRNNENYKNEFKDLYQYFPVPPDEIYKKGYKFKYNLNKPAIPVNESIKFIELKGDAKDSTFLEFREKFIERMRDLDLEVFYTDIYENDNEWKSMKNLENVGKDLISFSDKSKS